MTTEFDDQEPEGARIVFLDLEGVVVSHKSILSNMALKFEGADRKPQPYHGGHPGWVDFIDKAAFGLIVFMCLKHNAQIVLTSVLRTKDNVLGDLKALADQIAGFPASDRIFHQAAPATGHGATREAEICRWLQDELDAGRDLGPYCVIDDRKLAIENFVQVDQREGFNFKNYILAQGFLCDKVQPELIFL